MHGLVPSARIPADAVLADPVAAARQAVAAVGHGADGFLVHLDVDVLDMFTLPLADIPQYGRGLTPPVLRRRCSRVSWPIPRWSGLVVTEANPDRDDEHGTSMRRPRRPAGVRPGTLDDRTAATSRHGAPAIAPGTP